jgi:hypothetical protein
MILVRIRSLNSSSPCVSSIFSALWELIWVRLGSLHNHRAACRSMLYVEDLYPRLLCWKKD